MTSFFSAVKNLTEQAAAICIPWEFRLAAPISDEIRFSKKTRQEFYKNPATAHQFYSACEGANPNMRISKSNPTRKIHGIVADFDLALSAERIAEAISKMKYPPSFVERSLGGNARLVFLFVKPLLVSSDDFAIFVLQQAREWLALDLLPGLDKAIEDPARLYANGAEWAATGAPSIAEKDGQTFFFQCGERFNFRDTGENSIPLDVVEAELRKKYPAFTWPGDFVENASGPSFWVPGSESTNSAIVKKGGMFTFSAHADRPFYDWNALLSAEFAKEFQTNSVALATTETYFDGKLYWKFNESDGRFVAMSREVLVNHLKVGCRVSSKPDKTGMSFMDRCLNFIHEYGRVEGGAPILFQPPGLVIFTGNKLVNTSPKSKLILPSGVESAWGAQGNFPFISSVLDNLFDPPSQLPYFLAWLQYFYKTALNQTPAPGQNIFLAGAAGVGKTLLNREIVGALMGGFTDAGRFMMGDAAFNSSLFGSAVWAIDDSTCSDSESARRKFASYIKLIAANSSHEYRKKFENSVMIPFQGRVICTCNLDASSSRSLPVLDESTAEKISLFRCVSSPRIVFPDRESIKRSLAAELPNFAQWLVQWTAPAETVGESRYGVRAYHCPELLNKSHQATRSAPFKELLVEFLVQYFSDNPNALEWRGSCTQLLRSLHSNPLNESVLRSLKIESVNLYLEELSRDEILKCRAVSGERRTRIWIIERFEQ